MNKITGILCCCLCMYIGIEVSAQNEFEWAEKGVNFCRERQILQGDENGNLNLGANLTKSEMAKIISVAFSVEEESQKLRFTDIEEQNWAYKYIRNIQDFIADESSLYRPFDYATREEFFSCVMYAADVDMEQTNTSYLGISFKDYKDVSEHYTDAMNSAAFYGYVKGDDAGLRPLDNLTRAEACVFMERMLNEGQDRLPGIPEPTNSKYSYSETLITAPSEHTLEEAIAWAEKNNAAQCFIDAAPFYWQYGEIFGIRADVMYAQAAKETGFGKYGGKVLPEMNNWAGIKKYGAVGDATEDHESFATPDDGVRGHFNHMSAYVGVDPVGETHGRYKSVKSLKWAGTVKYVEQLGGKWCPDPNYGYSILIDYVDKM